MTSWYIGGASDCNPEETGSIPVLVSNGDVVNWLSRGAHNAK